jgi:hypothetical protein
MHRCTVSVVEKVVISLKVDVLSGGATRYTTEEDLNM